MIAKIYHVVVYAAFQVLVYHPTMAMETVREKCFHARSATIFAHKVTFKSIRLFYEIPRKPVDLDASVTPSK